MEQINQARVPWTEVDVIIFVVSGRGSLDDEYVLHILYEPTRPVVLQSNKIWITQMRNDIYDFYLLRMMTTAVSLSWDRNRMFSMPSSKSSDDWKENQISQIWSNWSSNWKSNDQCDPWKTRSSQALLWNHGMLSLFTDEWPGLPWSIQLVSANLVKNLKTQIFCHAYHAYHRPLES